MCCSIDGGENGNRILAEPLVCLSSGCSVSFALHVKRVVTLSVSDIERELDVKKYPLSHHVLERIDVSRMCVHLCACIRIYLSHDAWKSARRGSRSCQEKS